MDAKYQKIYDTIKGKNYSSYVSSYKSTMTSIKSKINSTEATINSSRWTEKGIELIKKSVIPSLVSQTNDISTAFDTLEKACSKIKDLESKLANLQSVSESYENAKAAYYNASEEDRDDLRKNVDYYNERVLEVEKEADTIISEINGLDVNIEDVSISYGESMDKLKEYTSFENMKAEFLGSLDDDSWWVDPAYAHKAKELLLFDNTTGEILKEGDTLNMKVGETRVLTVRIPHNAGRIRQVIRTSASGDDIFLSGHVVKAVCDINPDPNVVERVNYKYQVYWPEDMSILHTNYYDWIITATEEGGCIISQTCEYYVEENSGVPKAMVDIHVNVTD